MSATALVIKNEDSAWEYIKQALEGSYNNEVVELSFDNWPVFKLNVKGDRYDSTLPTSLMKSLIELQGHLNRVYAEVVYGKSAKSLTTEERSALEIVYKVEKGSSQVFADLSGFFSEMGKSAMEKMTGKQVVSVVAGVAAMFVAGGTYEAYLDNSTKTKAEQNRHELEMALVQNQPRLRSIQQEQRDTYTNLLKSVSDADNVTVGQTRISKSQIETITKQERQTSEVTRIDDSYLISSLKIKPDSYRIEIMRESDGVVIVTELFKGHLTIAEMEKITKAFMTEKPVNLKVVGRVRGNVIVGANIVGIDDDVSPLELSTSGTVMKSLESDFAETEIDSDHEIHLTLGNDHSPKS